MKRNKLFTLTLATCAALLSACSTELDTSGNPERAGADEAIVAVSLQFPSADRPAGYADNDVPEGVALDAEKEIRSIAFIAFTTGGTGVYLSTEPTFAETGFTQPLAPAEGKPIGNYTASFKIRSDNFTGKTTLVAVANFHEHGLTFDPGALTIESLKAMLTVALEADKSIEYPLLMTIAQEFDIVEGATVPVDFKMERIMARVDVLNSAYDKQTPANGFVLTSARLLSAAAQGTMIGGQEITAPTYVDLEVQDEVKEVEPAEGDDLTPIKQQLAPMYVYENANSEKDDATKLSATATSVEVKGTYKGKEYSKVISFVTPKKVVNGALEGGVIVPLARNHRYVVEIIAASETDVTFDLQVTDWAEGKRLDVELDFAAPVIEGLEGFNPAGGTEWDPVTRTLDVTHARGGSTFNLVARGNQDSDIAIQTVYDANDTPFAQHITTKRGELVGYAAEVGSLSRTYKIDVPDVFPDCPSMTKIILYNTSYADAQTVITVKYAPFFVGGWESSQPGAAIDPATGLIDLRNVADGQAGTVSFFASSGSTITVSELTNKGLTTDFYTATTEDVDDTDLVTYPKYGPGKRVTLSYKALSEKPEFAEVKVADTSTTPTSKEVFVKCVKNPYALTTTRSFNSENTYQNDRYGPNEIYLAINNGDHGTLDYELYDNEDHILTITPTATYEPAEVAGVKPKWVEGTTIAHNEVTETLPDYKIVKRFVKVALPTSIKNPASASSFKVGFGNETNLVLGPVYVTENGMDESCVQLAPVVVGGVWWAPVNIGQLEISQVGDPVTQAGNLFQWGRKQKLAWDSPKVGGPVDSAEAAGTNYITGKIQPRDWLTTPNDKLWNSGTEAAPVKTENDPCPMGWRVPTQTELAALLLTEYRSWDAAESPSATSANLLSIDGDAGRRVYFLAMGRGGCDGNPYDQGTGCFFWSSSPVNKGSSHTQINSSSGQVTSSDRMTGLPVRCVQE